MVRPLFEVFILQSTLKVKWKNKQTKQNKITACISKNISSVKHVEIPQLLINDAIIAVFSVTPFKIDQKKNQNCSIDKVQNLGNERRYINKDPRQDSGQRNIWYTRYPKKCFTQTLI